jgi:hypothetical protein
MERLQAGIEVGDDVTRRHTSVLEEEHSSPRANANIADNA